MRVVGRATRANVGDLRVIGREPRQVGRLNTGAEPVTPVRRQDSRVLLDGQLRLMAVNLQVRQASYQRGRLVQRDDDPELAAPGGRHGLFSTDPLRVHSGSVKLMSPCGASLIALRARE